MAATARLARLVDDRVEPGQAGDLLGAAEAARLADLGEQMAGEDRADPIDRLQRLTACVAAGETAQLAVDPVKLHLERGDDREQRVDLQPRVRVQAQGCDPAHALRCQQPRLRARPTLVEKEGVEPLSPAALVLGQRLAQPGAIAQPLDLLRRDPRLRQHLLRQQPRQPARVEPVCLGAAPPPQQRTRLHGLSQPHVEAARRELAPDPAPARRGLDRHRRDPAPPLLSPARKALPVGRKARLDHLAALRIEHRRLEGMLVDVDRCEQHAPPLDEQKPDRPQRSGQSPMTTTLWDVTLGPPARTSVVATVSRGRGSQS
jgi:hypothetical protein